LCAIYNLGNFKKLGLILMEGIKAQMKIGGQEQEDTDGEGYCQTKDMDGGM
jgi:hypothetical protein